MNNYKIIKKIIDNDTKEVSIIELDNEKYVLKRVKDNNKKLIIMLKNEVNILNKLKDSKVSPKLYSYNFSDTDNFIITSFIDGKTINELKFQSVKDKILLMLKIVNSIKIIHNLDIIHGDLKPDNILIDSNDEVKLIDFGISSCEKQNIIIGYGSVKYCSKDELLQNDIDETTDIYSLGIIFYELVLGKLPFGKTREEIISNKKKNVYEKTDNIMLNLVFSKIFEDKDNKYKRIDEFEKDLRIFLLG